MIYTRTGNKRIVAHKSAVCVAKRGDQGSKIAFLVFLNTYRRTRGIHIRAGPVKIR